LEEEKTEREREGNHISAHWKIGFVCFLSLVNFFTRFSTKNKIKRRNKKEEELVDSSD
jgi:hypothetical protein